MVASRKSAEASGSKRPPATTVEGRENQMISLAIEQAEKMMREGNAPAQIITHYLKLATTRERLEQEKLAQENELLRAKRDSIASGQRMEALYEDAIKAMRSYQGQEEDLDLTDYEN